MDSHLLAAVAAGSDSGGMLLGGFAMAILSAIFNGTFSMFGKLCREEPDPVVFNTFLTYGALFSSVLVQLLSPLWEAGEFDIGFTWYGALAGVVFVFATLFSFIAIPLAGLATSSVTWSCSAVIVAFLWGAVGPSPVRKAMKEPALAILGIGIMLIGVLVITLSGTIGRYLRPELAEPLAEQDRTELGEGDTTRTSKANGDNTSDAGGQRSLGREVLGLASAVTVGLFGGSVLVPASYAPAELAGLKMVFSFGIGAAAMGTLVGLVYWLIWRPNLSKEIRGEVILNGLIAGALWNAGNVCQIIAQDHFHLAYGISYPILQGGLLFSSLWGIYFFKEVTHCATIATFWAGALVLIGGVVLLGLFGPGA